MSTAEAIAGTTPDGAAVVPALAVEGVSHSFGKRRALDDVSFAVAAGEFAVLLGQNGAGKTTLFSLITRLYDNRSGAIRVFGHDVRRRPSEALARIGVVFQQRTLDLDLSVTQNLAYHAALHGLPKARARARGAAELARLDLAERAGDKVRQLSGGQLRRVEIARALLHEPKLLLLDEPTVGLDIGSRQSLLDHVRGLVREQNLGILWATHLIDEVAEDDRVVLLHQGVVLANDRAEAVVRRSGAADLKAAFTALTGAGGEEREA
ncbi:MAG: ATP-binding cassette domain-containing protein [Kiloniellales bacterium]|nr:ATP-binding cassette domain-containing protein [Kiloniellales bacterium]